jgi:hypothetical protein
MKTLSISALAMSLLLLAACNSTQTDRKDGTVPPADTQMPVVRPDASAMSDMPVVPADTTGSDMPVVAPPDSVIPK